MTHRGRQLVWLAMLGSIVMVLAALGFVENPPGGDRRLGWTLLALGAITVPAGVALPKLVKDPGAWLAALAICEAAALLGVATRSISGLPQAWTLPALSLIGMALLYPRKAN